MAASASSQRPVLSILAEVDVALAAIRLPDNGEDQDAYRDAHLAMAQLFAHGMIDTWRADDDEPMPSVEDWDWNAEPLEPGEDWSAAERTAFYRTCGDLCFLHSNDAGLNAAKSNYENALPALAQQSLQLTAQTLARLFRSATYASYGLEVMLDEISRVALVAEKISELPAPCRDEFELSLVEMFDRVTGGGTYLGSRDHEDADRERLFAIVQDALRALCARWRELPYRKAVPWLAMARWGRKLMSEEFVDSLRAELGADSEAAFVLALADRARSIEDGLFYPHGGALSCADYITSTAGSLDTLSVDAYVDLADSRAIDILDRQLAALSEETYHDADRVTLKLRRIGALAALKQNDAWRADVLALLPWLADNVDQYWWGFTVDVDEGLADIAARAENDGELIAGLDDLRERRAKAEEARRALYSY